MKDFDLITFDCYGTLIDWETGIFHAFRNEAAKDGCQLERGSVISAYVAAEAEIEGKGFIGSQSSSAGLCFEIGLECDARPGILPRKESP